MSALTLLQYIADALYVAVFLTSAARFLRRGRAADLDITLLFATTTVIVALSLIVSFIPTQFLSIFGVISSILLMSLPYLLLRLVEDFAGASLVVVRLTEAGLILSAISLIAIPIPYPLLLVGILILYFLVVIIYASRAFVVAARDARGVTKRRMFAVAFGSLFLGLDILAAGASAAQPGLAVFWLTVGEVTGVASGICYFIGFAPPLWLRQAWQAPEVRAAMRSASSLIRTPNQADVIRELERGSAEAIGASRASIALWHPDTEQIQPVSDQAWPKTKIEEVVAANAIANNRALASIDLLPLSKYKLPHGERGSALAAPIAIDQKRLGVLVVAAPRAPIFADEDLELLQLLADQAAVILENRSLVEDTARERARAEALAVADEERRRLNLELESRVLERTSELQQALSDLESFSYSVSHDLRAPLRTIDGFSQALLEDYAHQLPADGMDWLHRIRAASQTMGELIDGLLRLSRVSRSDFRSELVDLSALARSVCGELGREYLGRDVDVVIQDGLVAEGDPQLLRIGLDNLFANAWKFSSTRREARIEFSATQVEGQSIYCIKDNGVGFDMAYADKLFGPFQRLHRRDEFDGMGIGLATVQRIIRRHNGRIWAESQVDHGAEFCFTLASEPIAPQEQPPHGSLQYVATREDHIVSGG